MLARVEALESKPVLKYSGVWSASATYEPGEIVSHGGSSWHSNIKSQGLQPGESNPASWTLMTKRGRDARDARS
ncbi:carbohydrate-binding protein [Mesorhizobium sp. M7A.T.Ca.TU.009.02.1.1]|nr:carbohydrate-binding protein [Mesorhizobium sp. M7A.T.Ca.US.000.02.1.1]RUT91884.1 carbohydrate-binding protein [Mesorhizobium sp. M7A.T.Ca.US.000.02.2.1]RUT99732.1 carbohydrate-binding protein [Mesorhizobium sp. M7A.T.Ca.TU.009.02.1.1]RUU65021.1 carbohydrate-binding protein [Mesorhizobium sp. M7A.T.Ca.TU.009.01.1.1]RUU78724.1 carbohydrate-binding protein [Mesorhizobium sp. M7A.T.Ca.TU.009.01.1.2]